MTVAIFLTQEEWNTFRSLGRPITASDTSRFRGENPRTIETVCWFCGLRGSEANPLQAAHRIPAGMVMELAIRPDLLNRSDNFVWAHRRLCNDAVELRTEQVLWRLMTFGVKDVPSFLPERVQEAWKRESNGIFEEARPPNSEKRFASRPTSFPSVPPQTSVVRNEFKALDAVPAPPPPSSLRTVEPPKPSAFPTVPPSSTIRIRKPIMSSESHKKEGESK